jgi:hypothetical protein
MQFNVISLGVCVLLFPLASFSQSPPDRVPAETVATAQRKTSQNQQGNGNNGSSGNNGSAGNSASTSTPAVAVSQYTFPSNRKMVRFGFRGVAGFRALVGSAVGSSWNTWVRQSPKEWGNDASGWGKRFGTRVLDNGINQSTLVALSIATHRDPIYYRCDCSGVWPRTFHAIKMTYEGRDRAGAARFSVADVISPFVGPLITRNTIYPSRFDTMDGLRSGAYFMLGTAGWNIIREFFLKGPRW